jgi:hypothetical protein
VVPGRDRCRGNSPATKTERFTVMRAIAHLSHVSWTSANTLCGRAPARTKWSFRAGVDADERPRTPVWQATGAQMRLKLRPGIGCVPA